MAEGRSNAGLARRLWITEGTVEKHVRSILAKLSLPETDDDHRRVLAVLTFLEARGPDRGDRRRTVREGRGWRPRTERTWAGIRRPC